MARVAIAQNQLKAWGDAVGPPLSSTLGNNADDYYLVNTGRELLKIINNTAGAVQVTINGVAGPKTFGQEVDQVFSVAASGTRYVGPFDPAVYSQSDGTVHVDLDTVDASIGLTVYRLPIKSGY